MKKFRFVSFLSKIFLWKIFFHENRLVIIHGNTQKYEVKNQVLHPLILNV